MRKQCLTQWDLKRNTSFSSQSGLFDLRQYAEKLSQLNQCNGLALSAKWMPARLAPIHVLWTDEAVFSHVSRLCAPWCGRQCSGLLCCPATAPSEMLGVGKGVQKGFWHGSRGGACGWYWKAFFSVVLYISFPLSQKSDSPSHRREIVGLSFAFSF